MIKIIFWLQKAILIIKMYQDLLKESVIIQLDVLLGYRMALNMIIINVIIRNTYAICRFVIIRNTCIIFRHVVIEK